MSDNLTFAELEAQHVELLPPRTVLSLFSVGKPGVGKPGVGHNYNSPLPAFCAFVPCTVNATAGTGTGGAAG
jgi:hypothetical protein